MIANENYPWMKKPVINKEDFMLLIKNFSKFNYLRRFGAGCCIMKTCLLYWLQYGVDYIMSMHYGGLLWNSEKSKLSITRILLNIHWPFYCTYVWYRGNCNHSAHRIHYDEERGFWETTSLYLKWTSDLFLV